MYKRYHSNTDSVNGATNHNRDSRTDGMDRAYNVKREFALATPNAQREEAAVAIHIHPFYFAAIVLIWIAVYHIAYWAVAIARDPSLVCWSVGLFGISVVSPREPPLRRLLVQLAVAALTLGVISYASLFALQPPPIAGLSQAPRVQLLIVAIPVALLTLARITGVVRERRHPLWGEARVLAGVQRSLATGAHIYFTPNGRAYLRERFQATPLEFLRMVRL